jgi:hypothetical protein
MAEIRCPMCSAANPEGAQVCVECGARLTPLIAGEGQSGMGSDYDAAEASTGRTSEGDDWLDRIRRGVEPPTEDEPDEPADTDASSSPDWLNELRQADSSYDEGPPPSEQPDWMDEFIAAGDGEETSEEDQDEEVPDWLARIRQKTRSQEIGVTDEDDDWITSLREEDEQAPISSRPSGLDELEPAPEEDEPTSELPQSAPLDLGALSSVPPPDRPSGEWKMFEEGGEAGVGAETAAGPPADFSPGSFLEGETEGEGGLPHVPALIPEDTGEKPIIEIDEKVLDSAELPGWLEQIKPALAALEEEEAALETEEGSDGEPDLAPATLPSWLEAMRPVDAFRPEIEIETEDEQPVESAGPLAGLRGVLMAEPVVAKPRTSSASASRLEVTERQYAQAELLQRLVDQEARSVAVGPEKPFTLPIARWLVTLVLLIAILLPFGFDQIGIQGFSTPSVVSPDLPPLISLVNNVPLDRPALVVFDYTPGYSGELDTVAASLLTHLSNRSIPIVTLSTRVTGPPLAERLMRAVHGEDAANGQQFIHLGFLSGGPTAIQLFAVSPRDAILTGFRLPEGLTRQTLWSSPLLQNVNRLSDFGVVIVITAGTETARTWAEQTHPWIEESPLVMILSAGAEPLIRPYYESLSRQVDGILTGLPSAVAYQQNTGQELSALQGWDSFGSGLMMVELILLAGIGFGGLRWLLEWRSS